MSEWFASGKKLSDKFLNLSLEEGALGDFQKSLENSEYCAHSESVSNLRERTEWAIKNGDLSELEYVLRQCGMLENVCLLDQILARPAIVIAADYGQNDVIKFFLERGSDVNVLDKFGISPLLAAIWENHSKAVEILLTFGASLNKNQSPSGKSYFDEASGKDAVLDVIERFL
uniref:myotrophin-like n=1 Tax=Styela clava TaxID=7725 RepID=UPI00193A4260|nr:myotrophin-like [Styela clava]